MKHGGALGQFTSTADEFQQDNINNFSITDEINTRKHSSVVGEGEGEQGGDEISEIVRISTCRKLAKRGKNSTSTFACNLVSELWGREAINSLSLRSSSLSALASHPRQRKGNMGKLFPFISPHYAMVHDASVLGYKFASGWWKASECLHNVCVVNCRE